VPFERLTRTTSARTLAGKRASAKLLTLETGLWAAGRGGQIVVWEIDTNFERELRKVV